MFAGVLVERHLAVTAVREARLNWDWWSEDFCHTGSFSEMPVFQSYPRFRGFGADYSEFRGLTARELDRLRSWFCGQPDPLSFGDLFQRFSAVSPGQKRISLLSKLLTLWRPQEYAMWDTLARSGLKRLHGSQRGHCYSGQNASDYEVFRDDFFELYSAAKNDLMSEMKPPQSVADPADFALRILDNYLMLVGRE